MRGCVRESHTPAMNIQSTFSASAPATRRSKTSSVTANTTPKVTRQTSNDAAYLTPTETRSLLANSAIYRAQRLSADDMSSTDEAAKLIGTTRVTINNWIKSGRCIALTQLRRGYRLPKWQFDPAFWERLPALIAALHAADGWSVLGFLESPHPALDGLTPRAAIERGLGERVVAVAMVEAY